MNRHKDVDYAALNLGESNERVHECQLLSLGLAPFLLLNNVN